MSTSATPAAPGAATPGAPHGAPPGATRPTGSRRGGFVTDTLAVAQRELMLVVREPFGLIFSLLQPLVFLGLFAPLLVGSMPGVDTAATLQWFVPGVLVMVALFGTGTVGSNLQYELMTGSYERMLATPLSRASLIVGRAVKELLPLVVQAALIAVVAMPFGFEVHVAHAALGLLLLGVFGVGLGSLSYALALATRSAEWAFWAVQQTLIFPLLILSGMMLPLDDGPGWLRVAAAFNPLTYVVDAERALFAGELGADAGLGAVAAALTCAVGLWVGVRTVRTDTR